MKEFILNSKSSILLFMSFSIILHAMSTAKGQDADALIETARGCRAIFPAEDVPPDAPGGWAIISSKNEGDTLCLVGTLESVVISELANRMTVEPIKQILVRSAGGPSQKWLAIAEILLNRNAALIVDDLCLSACAIYLAPIAKNILTISGSIVAWHGGAGPDTLANPDLTIDSVATAVGLADLEERTIRLYDAAGASPRILGDSVLETDRGILARVIEALPEPIPPSISVIGYAYSPQTLRDCFGFMNAGNMWHPGGDIEVAQLANTRNRSLIALESPKNRDGTPICKK